MIREDVHIVKGMQRDTSVSKASNEYVFEAHNIRITARDNNTLFSITNEKGNKLINTDINTNIIPNKISFNGTTIETQYPVDSNIIIKFEYTDVKTGNREYESYTIEKGKSFAVVSYKYKIDIKLFIESDFIDAKYIYYTDDDNKLDYTNINTIPGTYLGSTILDKYVVIFSHDSSYDYIHRLYINNEDVEIKLLYKGNLGFSEENPIEAISIYETEDIQKVYWIDGKNQARVINIVANYNVINNWNDNSFDFVQTLKLNEQIEIEKSYQSNGKFQSGVIQYAFSYYNKYGQESNIFYTSPLHYISYIDRGSSPEDKVSNSFTIKLKNVDSSFDYIRVYSIHRSSINATPVVTKVTDLTISNNTNTIFYTDNGIEGESLDPTYLLYVGGESIIAKSFTQKDGTLFLGNISLDKKLISENIIKKLRNGILDSYLRPLEYSNNSNGEYYNYNNTLFSSNNKSFKNLEYYRFGIQFQYKTGKWSEPIFIADKQITSTPQIAPYNNNIVLLPSAIFKMNKSLAKEVYDLGFIRARGVVVYPSDSDREIFAQGMLCPTVYNVGDRFDNKPFAISSWFSRPNAAFDVERSKDNWKTIGNPNILSADSPAGMFWDNNYKSDYDKILARLGSWSEFRHNKPIPSNWNRNAEIQCISYIPELYPYTSAAPGELQEEVSSNQENFYVDQSILTFHSPDIELSESIPEEMDLKLRIVGIIPITANSSDIDITTSTNPVVSNLGFRKEFIGSKNKSYHAYKSLLSGIFYYDSFGGTSEEKLIIEGYLTYPWHRTGSLNSISEQTEDSPRKAMIKHKKMSNLKFSQDTKYFKPWNAETDSNHTGITKVKFFKSDNVDVIKIPAPLNSKLSDLNYYGNIDKVVVPSRNDYEYKVIEKDVDLLGTSYETSHNKNLGYPIVMTVYSKDTLLSPFSFYNIFSKPIVTASAYQATPAYLHGYDPVHIKYKSTPHAVFAFNYTEDGKQVILPTHRELVDKNYINVNSQSAYPDELCFFWNKERKEDGSVYPDHVYQDTITDFYSDIKSDAADNYGYLYIAELYNDNVINRFGGTSEEAFENNQWLPAGEPVLLNDLNNTSEYVDIMYTEGDTYYQRYDCLKTYPYTMEDTNSIVEIVSFMCETRVNIDGRYDRNRGQISNLVMTPNNFNRINPVYSQKNNFFNYRGLNTSKYSQSYFPNTITWTKEKQAGAIIDTWTNITVASTLDMDGSKGNITALKNFNNEIFCFQEQALSNILFNSRVQIPTSDGVPIEITNGLKVGGKRYISEIGCNNKWSIVESPMGLYFIDNITKGIYLFNGQITSISGKCGLEQWIGQYGYNKPWNPKDFNNFISFYDKNSGDVYFVNKEECLCYSESIGQFTSFMDYNNVPAMFNVKDKFYSIKNNRVWEQFAGDYNMFYGIYKPYSMTFISNPDEPYDKIFDNIEFRSDSWEGNKLKDFDTFDKIEVWNEYQRGESDLDFNKHIPSSLKKKFRIWRVNIPRDNSNNRDRIRNTWTYIKLSKNTPNKYRTEFHDMIVKYFI